MALTRDLPPRPPPLPTCPPPSSGILMVPKSSAADSAGLRSLVALALADRVG